MLQNGSSTCLQGPHLPARLLRPSRPATRKGLCQSGVAPEVRDPSVRYDLVARVRREIVAGTYDTPAKMELAMARMLARGDLAHDALHCAPDGTRGHRPIGWQAGE